VAPARAGRQSTLDAALARGRQGSSQPAAAAGRGAAGCATAAGRAAASGAAAAAASTGTGTQRRGGTQGSQASGRAKRSRAAAGRAKAKMQCALIRALRLSVLMPHVIHGRGRLHSQSLNGSPGWLYVATDAVVAQAALAAPASDAAFGCVFASCMMNDELRGCQASCSRSTDHRQGFMRIFCSGTSANAFRRFYGSLSCGIPAPEWTATMRSCTRK